MLWTSRATPQTPHRSDPLSRHGTTVAHEQTALPTLRDRADFPSCGVVASLLGIDPTASAPPCLRGNLPRSRPRRILRQAPGSAPLLPLCITKYLTRHTLVSCTLAPAASLRLVRQSTLSSSKSWRPVSRPSTLRRQPPSLRLRQTRRPRME